MRRKNRLTANRNNYDKFYCNKRQYMKYKMNTYVYELFSNKSKYTIESYSDELINCIDYIESWE